MEDPLSVEKGRPERWHLLSLALVCTTGFCPAASLSRELGGEHEK